MAKNFPPRGAGNEQLVSAGGDRVIPVPKAATTLVASGGGRLCRAQVLVAGTDSGTVQFVDSPDVASVAASSNIEISALPGTIAVGPQPGIDMPFKNGCVCVNPANGPVLAVSVVVNG